MARHGVGRRRNHPVAVQRIGRAAGDHVLSIGPVAALAAERPADVLRIIARGDLDGARVLVAVAAGVAR